jgi:acyl carrier protein
MDRYAEIRAIIAKELALEERVVVPEAHLVDDLGADSIGILTLVEVLSARYGIELVEDDLVDMENVGDLSRFIDSKISSKA